jgi:hypothetical protein
MFRFRDEKIPVSRQEIPGSISQGISVKPLGVSALFDARTQSMTHPIYKIPGYFP